jgi:TolB protein
MIAIAVVFLGPASGVLSGETGKGKIVFSSYRSGNWELWTIEPDGRNLTRITRTPDAEERSPAWSPGGARIAYSTNRGQICVMDADGKNRQAISEGHENCDHPTWHPSGGSVAFISYKVKAPGDEDSDIWQVEFGENGTGQPRKVVSLEGIETYPAWSSDSNTLAFSRLHRDATFGLVVEEIWTKNMTTEATKELTRTGSDNVQVDWSPGGDAIAFASNLSGNYDIWLIGTAHGYLKRLTDEPAYDGDPCWSRDGTQIVFVSTRGGSRQLWIMNSDGTNQKPLTSGPAENRDPCWSRDGRVTNESNQE